MFEEFRQYAKTEFDYDIVNVSEEESVTFEELFGENDSSHNQLN